jgi:hypothetical protein
LYCWSDGLPQKTKIKEAYDMLKKQGIVQVDPTYVDKVKLVALKNVNFFRILIFFLSFSFP